MTRPKALGPAHIKLKPIDRQVVVITGATSGIGLVTARQAARRGASVFLIARDEAALEDICADISRQGGHAAFAAADVGDQTALAEAAQGAVDRFGGYDAWIHVAGVNIASPILKTPRREHEKLFQTNYWGVVNACTTAIPHLREKGGAVIIVGSIVADIGAPVYGAYAASKHAVKGFVDSLRIELIADRAPISLTLVKPDGVGTPLDEHTADHMAGGAKIPPPAYSPNSVANAILYAADHPRREMIVGGAGALQILAATLAPHLSDLVSSLVGPLLFDPSRPTSANNLFSPRPGGSERSKFAFVLPFSLFSVADRHRRLTACLCTGGVIGLAALLTRRRPASIRQLKPLLIASGAHS